MKKSFILASALVMGATLVGCSSDEPVASTTGANGVVSFTITMPGNLSRAINDGYKAVDVTYAVYDADNGDAFLFQDEVTGAFDGLNLETKIDIQLVTGKSYKVAFFAKNAAAPYKIENGTLTIDYSDVTANSDIYDAFYGMADVVKVEEGMANPSATLTRPFAQVNVGAADYEAAVKAGYTVTETGMTFTAQIPTTMSMLDGTVGDPTAVTYKVSAVPEDPTITVASKDYAWVAMNYVLASKDDATVNTVTFQYADPNGATTGIEVNSVPVKRNYRTNIVGNFFTSTVSYDIVIDPEFGTPDNNVGVKVATPSQFAAAINAIPAGGSGVITLTSDINWTSSNIPINGKTVLIDLAGHTFTTSKYLRTYNNAEIEINNGTIVSTGENCIWNGSGNTKMANVTINHTGTSYAVRSGVGTLDMTDCKVTSSSSYVAIITHGTGVANLTNVEVVQECTNQAAVYAQGTSTLNIEGGKITAPIAGVNIIQNPTVNINGAEIVLTTDEVTPTSAGVAIYSQYATDTPVVNVTDTKISGGSYGVTTEGTRAFSPTATITNCDIEARCGICWNVPGTLTVTGGSVSGYWQAAFMRGGTSSFTNVALTLDTDKYASDADAQAAAAEFAETWSIGCQVTKSAFTFGNSNTTSFDYETTVTLTGCAVSVTGAYASYFPQACGKMANDKAVSLTYDAATTFTGGLTPDIASGVTFAQR